MEGPYHPKSKRIGEHMHGITLLIEIIPYHFKKYTPTKEELRKYDFEYEGEARFSKGGYVYRLVPFTK